MCGKSAIIFWPGEQRKSLDDIRRLQKSAMPEGLNVHKRVWWGGPVSKFNFGNTSLTKNSLLWIEMY